MSIALHPPQAGQPDPYAHVAQQSRVALLLPQPLVTAIAHHARTHGRLSQSDAIRDLLLRGLSAPQTIQGSAA